MNRNVVLSSLAVVTLAFAGSASACGDVDDSQAHAVPSALMASAPAASKVPSAKMVMSKSFTKSAAAPKAVQAAESARSTKVATATAATAKVGP